MRHSVDRRVTPNEIERLTSELDFLAELSRVVASSNELEPVLDWIVNKTTALLSADEGSIKLLQPETGSAVTVARVRTDREKWPPALSASVTGYLLRHGEVLATRDLLNDQRFPGFRGLGTTLRSLLAVPLRVENRITGILAVAGRTPGRDWTPDEQNLLSIVAGRSAEVIERTRIRAQLREKEIREAERQAELAAARKIQLSLIPSQPLRSGPWEAVGRVFPAGEVGGDYFDFYPLGMGRFGLAIADVEGKGVPAALLVSFVRAQIRASCDGRRPISEAVRHVNESLFSCPGNARFVSLFYGEVDHRRGLIQYTNAGHPHPLVRRSSGALEKLETGGFPLGAFQEATYQEDETVFASGDAMLLYSDGVFDAENMAREDFGLKRLETLWRSCTGLASAQAVDRVFAAVHDYRGAASQGDDITVVVVSPPEEV